MGQITDLHAPKLQNKQVQNHITYQGTQLWNFGI